MRRELLTALIGLAPLACHSNGGADSSSPPARGTTMQASATGSPPSRTDLLKTGGLYPVSVPLGWKLIDEAGQDVAIPAVPGDPFHRILARGALLATEIRSGPQPEVMTLRQYALPAPLTPTILD